MSNYSDPMWSGRSMHRMQGQGLRRSMIALGIAMCCSAPLYAQQADTQADADSDAKPDAKSKKDKPVELEAVNVTGMRASLVQSQVIKRDSSQIVDSVSAEDIGALPDRSVTETLQRVSGVTIDHFMARNDPDHFSAEGSGVMIRGLTQVRGELNGRDIFSANSGRGLSFEDVPAELMAGVDVYKNPSAEIIEGGLGGTVNLRTRMPFDSPGRVIGGNVDVNYGDFSKKYKPSGSFLYSDRWNTGIGEMGFLLDVAYSELSTRTDGIQAEPYTRRTDSEVLAGTDRDEVYVPGGMNWRQLDFERKRKGIAAAFQWKPSDDTEIYTQYLRSTYEMQWLEHAVLFGSDADTIVPADGTTFNYDSNGVFISGTPQADSSGTPLRLNTDTRFSWQRTTTSDLSAGFKHYLTDRIKLSGDAQLVESESNALDFTTYMSTYVSGLSYDLSGSYPSVTTTSSTTDASDYYWYAAMDHHAQNRARELALRADLEYTFMEGDWLRYAKFGLRSTDRNQTNKSSGYNWGAISDSWAAVDSSSGLADISSYLSSYAQLYSFSNFYKGGVNVPSSLYFPAASLVTNYSQAVDAIQSIYASRGWGWSPDSYGVADINRQGERTQAGYAILYFGNDEAAGAGIDGNIGVRVVQTKTEADGYGQYPDLSDSVASSALQSQYYGQYFAIQSSGRYTNVLPSFNLRVKLTDDLQWRFAVSKAMARPDYSQLQAYLSLGATVDDNTGEVTKWTGTAGNPDLKPMTANQFDMALEWYFDSSDMIYGTLFYKSVRDYFASQTRTETYDGQDYLITRPYNMDKGIIRGFEFGYTQFFDSWPGWLSGFGVNANFTFVDSRGGRNTATDPYTDSSVDGVSLPLEGLSRRSYNLAAIYEKGRISSRLAYNWRSRYLLTTSDASTALPTWADDYGQLDASVFYHINDHIQLGLQVNNVTNEETKVLMGPTVYEDGEVDYRLYTRGWFITDRRYSMVLRMNW